MSGVELPLSKNLFASQVGTQQSLPSCRLVPKERFFVFNFLKRIKVEDIRGNVFAKLLWLEMSSSSNDVEDAMQQRQKGKDEIQHSKFKNL